MRELVFVHGRSQQQKDPAALKGEWIDALRRGLAKSGLDLPIPETAIRFPYYGDTLYQLTSGQPSAEVIVRAAVEGDTVRRDFYRDVLNDVLNQNAVTDADIAAEAASEGVVIDRGVLNWTWVQAGLRALDRSVGFASSASVALFTEDVYNYLNTPGTRDKIDAGVRKALSSGKSTVVVSHSLGTVIAYGLLNRDGGALGWSVPLFVTLGSPLAINAIKRAFRPISHPDCVGVWFNARDPRDVVALYPLDAETFPADPAIENKSDIDNFTDNRHGIIGYLDDVVVARRIYDALTES